MPAEIPATSHHNGLDLFVGAGRSLEECIAAIDGVLGLGRTQFVEGENIDALVAAIERATVGWAVCHASDQSDYPHKIDLDLVDGRSPIDAVPEIARRLGVAIVVPDEGTDDPYAGLRFDPDGTVRAFSLAALDIE